MTEQSFKLLAIVAVDPSHRVRCQQPNCGHSVYARIHVVEDAGNLFVLGSDCFAKRYGDGHVATVTNGYGGGGRMLTDAEREMLIGNTKALLAKFEAERLMALELAEQERKKEIKMREDQRTAMLTKITAFKERMAFVSPPRLEHKGQPMIGREPAPVEVIPLPSWAYLKKQHSSIFAYGLGDGQCWVLIQSATHEGCFIAPAPNAFESWDEALPTSLGVADIERGVYVSESNINVLSGWFLSHCKTGSRIDSDPVAIQRFALECRDALS